MMKRREFLKHSATGAAALLLPSACFQPTGNQVPEPTGQPRSMLLRGDGTLVFVGGNVTLEVDRAADVVWMDRGGSRVVVGGRDAGSASLNGPVMAGLEPGNNPRVHVVDRGHGRVQVYALSGAHLETRGQGVLNMPGGAAFSEDGTLLVADTLNHRVVALDPRGRVSRTLGTQGDGVGQFNAPLDVTVDHQGLLHVLDAGNGRVAVLNAQGAWQGSYLPAGGRLRCALAITTGTDGAIYVAEGHGACVLAFHPNGTQLAVHRPVQAGARLTPLGLSFGSAGDLHISGVPGAPV